MTTVEGLGSTRDGLSAEQDRLSRFHGTQCGFCTPGMVMSMHGLRRRTEKAREEEPALETVEGVLDGNLCRCTGYRPILDAFKSFSPDAPDELKKKVGPIKRFLNYSIFFKVDIYFNFTAFRHRGPGEVQTPQDLSQVRASLRGQLLR